ncbi:MAG: hypothetical protein IKL84_06025 [Clostridia bacterium]|nr:hypothetical protein [Clostridia bacterium]
MKILTRILLIFLSVLLTVLLVFTTLSSSLISCVRAHFTPEYIYNYMNSIDYASLELPDGNGNTAPLCDIINDQTHDLGIYFTEDDLNGLIRAFSLDAVLTSYMQDVRSWALDDGPVPMLDADEVAETILTGVDDSLYMFISMFGDPKEALSDAVSGMVSAADFSHIFESGGMIRKILAADTMIFIISLGASAVLLILIANRLKIVPAAVYTGLACIAAGSVMLFARQILAPYKAALFAGTSSDMLPESLIDSIYLPFMETVHRTGTFIALGGLAALIVFSVIGTFSAMIAREKAASAAARERGQNMAYAQSDCMSANFEAVPNGAARNPSAESEPAEDAVSDKNTPEDGENHNDTDY